MHAERDLLEEQGIESPLDYYGVAVMKAIKEDMEEKKAVEAIFAYSPLIFAFGKRNVISDLSHFNLVLAWIWLAANQDVVGDVNEFQRQFKKSLRDKALEKKQRAEAEKEKRTSASAGRQAKMLEGGIPPLLQQIGLSPPFHSKTRGPSPCDHTKERVWGDANGGI
jgi:hypothetical protein